jgi:hypothetical protein
MRIQHTILACLPCLLAAPLLAQPQIGGGTCTSSTLNGAYSLMLTGRDLSSAVAFSNILQGIGTATFDGLSKVTFSLTNNTNKTTGVPQTQSGTYSLQSNCIGVVNITSGDTASYILGVYNTGEAYFITGQDGTYSLLGSGNTVPASCTAGTLTGVYTFNGNGDSLTSGTIAGVNNISGLLTFDGTSAVTGTWFVSASGTSKSTATTGTYAVTAGCTATANVTDSSGNAYALVFAINSTAGAFVVSGANPTLTFSASGRPL